MSKSDITSEPPGSSDLVVVGASAGGVEALSILISTLPADFPAPIVLAQHLDPHRPSALDTILQRRTQLPVVVVQASTSLEAGTIYVVPSNHHVAIRFGFVELLEDYERRPSPSVDLLLSSAASAYGERLIAVILTGSGSDGAAGAIDVKSSGGTIIVQDPKTARYPSMPLALPHSIVDIEASIDQIGPLLYGLLIGGNLPQHEAEIEDAQDTLRDILEQVSRQANIDFRSYKTATLLRRVGRRMTATHTQSISEYAHSLEVHPSEIGELVKALLINVTQFFRDPDAFAHLKRVILPKLVAQARERDHVLRFWSAGCATGEEPYSLAMLLVDLLGNELADWSIKIFATDVDGEAIAFARRGLYSEGLLKNVPVEYQELFFERVDHGYRITKALRQIVIFGQQNLSRSAPFPHIDLVLCRNVLIYFMPELQNYVLSQFAYSLRANGYLFLGKSETVRPNQSSYELISKRWKMYRCADATLSRYPLQHLTNRPLARSLEVSSRLVSSKGDGVINEEVQPELLQLRRSNERLLRFLPVGIVVIDQLYHILTANGEARRLLGLRDASAERDFLHGVHGIPYATVRQTIDLVFRERRTVMLPEVELENNVGGPRRFLSLSISLIQMEPGVADLAAISVSDVTEQIQIRQQLEIVRAEQEQTMHELSAANSRLNDLNKGLLDSNEELQVANEELLLTHEELQATLEEFETSNEELQATNEELETSSEELQATNEELETTNDELRASGAELHELTVALENEKRHLTELIECAPYHIMVLRGPGLLIEAFHPHYAQRPEAQKGLGQPLEVVYDDFWAGGPEGVRLAREAYQCNEVRITPRIRAFLPETAATNGKPVESYVVYTMVPTHDSTGKVSGVLMYSIDETMQRNREMLEEREKFKLLLDHVEMAALALYDARTGELMIGNQRYLDILARTHEVEGSDLVGCTWAEMAFITPHERALESWQQVIESGIAQRVPEVHWNIPREGKETIWDCSLTPVMSQEKLESRYFILFTAVEITEQAQARQEMERLSLLKDEFIALASHELRTPLTSILGNAEFLQLLLKKQGARTDITNTTNAADTAQQQGNEPTARRKSELQHLDRIVYQVGSMSRMINDMLDITRMRGEMFELRTRDAIDMVALTRHVVEQFQTNTGRAISLETSHASIRGNVDEERVEQALNNLVSNALKYSPITSTVSVGIELRSAEHDRPCEVIIWVQDQGEGISEENQTHIFDRFYRATSNKKTGITGLGLGLYIASEIVERHGGRMWVESHVGAGSTFYIALPLAEVAVSEPLENPPPSA